MTIREIYDWVDSRAPFSTQLDFDNSGLLLGDPAAEVTTVVAALDLTDAVIDEAEEQGAQLVLTHHPVLFHGTKSLREDNGETRLLCRMIRSRIGLIAAHTCLDRAPGGINDVLAQTIGLTDIGGEDFLRVGCLPEPMTAGQWAGVLSDRLHTVVRVMGREDRMITRAGLCSGSGGEFWPQALEMGAQGFVSGEIRHHEALAASMAGMTLFECGHHATEEPGIFSLADALQKQSDALQ